MSRRDSLTYSSPGTTPSSGRLGKTAAEREVRSLEGGRARAMAAAHVTAGTLPCVAFGLVDAAGRSRSAVASKPGRSIDERSIFFLASVTKGIVATAIMRYVDEGRLDVHAPLTRYLPEFDSEGREAVSAWHVLTHTSGLPDIALQTLQRQRPTYQRALG